MFWATLGVCRGALFRSKSSLRTSRRSASYCEGAFNRYALSCGHFRYASLPTVSRHLKSRKHSPLTAKAIRQIAHRYISDGLGAAVYAKQRPGAQEILDGPQKQRIVAMVCSKPPEGRARWTVRLIAEEAVKRKLAAEVGRETIRVLPQSHELKPWREKNVVHSRVGPGVHPEDGRRAGDLREAL